MCFKDIRYLIYSDLDLIVEDGRISDVDTSNSLIDKYDSYEVIGIRCELDKIVISLKPYKSISDIYFDLYKESLEESNYQQCKK